MNHLGTVVEDLEDDTANLRETIIEVALSPFDDPIITP